MGPMTATPEVGADIGPHPHTGLQTVTWLTAGELLHRDSLGSEQLIRAGQLNLMTAGHGVSHAEQSTGTYAGELGGIQLWVAQPEATRHGPAAFEHHAELPQLELDHGTATVIVGELGDTASPARRDTDHLGAELRLRGGETTVPIHPHHEHALVVLDGAVEVDGTTVTPGHLAYLGTHRDELGLRASEPATAILLGGTPFDERLFMWWNFVARTTDEVDDARASWNGDDGRFGTVASPLSRIAAPPRS
jgi:redox-sensitive bicupin YhaK (pirin superfamily)